MAFRSGLEFGLETAFFFFENGLEGLFERGPSGESRSLSAMSDSALWRFFRSIRAASADSAGAASVAAASAGAGVDAGAGADAGAGDAVIFTSGFADAGAGAEVTVASGIASLVGGADAVVISVAVATDDASADCARSAGDSAAADGAAVEGIASAGGAKVEGSVAAAVAVSGVVGCVSCGGAAADSSGGDSVAAADDGSAAITAASPRCGGATSAVCTSDAIGFDAVTFSSSAGTFGSSAAVVGSFASTGSLAVCVAGTSATGAA